MSFIKELIWAYSFDHPLVQTTIKEVVEEANKCHSAIKSTLTIAKHGHTFVNDVATLYEALGEKQRSPEHLNELLLNLGKITAKAYKRSVRSCEQLKAVREMLFQVSVEVLCSLIQKTSCIPSFDQQISENMASKASTIGQDMLSNAGPDDDAVPFNGVETCFITFPRNIAAVETDIWPPSNLYLGSTFDDDEDSDDEGEVVQKKPSARAAWISCASWSVFSIGLIS